VGLRWAGDPPAASSARAGRQPGLLLCQRPPTPAASSPCPLGASKARGLPEVFLKEAAGSLKAPAPGVIWKHASVPKPREPPGPSSCGSGVDLCPGWRRSRLLARWGQSYTARTPICHSQEKATAPTNHFYTR